MKSSQNRKYYFEPQFLLLSFGFLFFMFCYSSFFFLPEYLGILGAEEFQIGAAMGIAGIINFLICFHTGGWIDKFGSRKFILAGSLLMISGSAGFYFIDSFGVSVYLLRLTQGAGFALGFPAALAYASDLAPENRRAQAIGIFGTGGLVSFALAPATAEIIRDAAGFKVAFLAASGFAVIALLLCLPLKNRAADSTDMPGSSITAVLRAPGIGATMFLGIVFSQGFGGIFNFLTHYISEIGIGQAKVFFICYSASAITVRLLGGRAADTINRRIFIAGNLLLLALSALLLSRLGRPVELIPIGLMFGVCQGYLYPTLSAQMIDLVADADRGKALALFSGSFSIGVLISGAAFGGIAQAFGYRTMYIVLAVTVALLASAARLIPKINFRR